MKLFILDETFELDNKVGSIEEIFDYIKQALEETEYNFSYMIIDGKEIYDEFEIFLEDNIKSVDEVKVVMFTTRDIVRDNLFTIEEYVEKAVPIIKNLADGFYKGPIEDNVKQISELIEGIGFIFHTFTNIDTMENLNEIVLNREIWNEYAKEVKSLEDILKELELALKADDNTLIGDLLLEKIIPIFKNMKDKLNTLLAVN